MTASVGLPRCFWNVRAVLGEGPIYDQRDRSLYFVDIKGQRLHRISLSSGTKNTWDMPEPICWVIPRASEAGFVAGFQSGFAFLKLDPLSIQHFGSPEIERPTNRLNDGKADRAGRVWAGSMDNEEKQDSGALYRLDPMLHWMRMDDGYGVANGPTFSPVGDKLYHADSAKRVVYRFDLAEDGTLSDRQVFTRFEDSWGFPDGMTTDQDGHVWIAHWDGSRVSRFTPEGRLDRSIPLPVSRPTSCTFGGDRLDRLFVTSAAIGKNDEPLAGGLFEVDAGVCGLPANSFAG